MAGLFPGVSNSQNVDRNGVPLAGATLTIYQGGTLVLASCFQDIGLAIPAQNPMVADITGRLPIFYVADGVYRVHLDDSFGVTVYDYPQVASIGASTGGGGGSAVDPTTVFQTGDELWKKIGGARTGWVRQNGRTIGSATSGASERANSDCQNLFLYLWNNYPNLKCPVIGGRGVSAAADWAANKQITLYDMRGIGPHGLDGMGNTRANVIPDSVVSGGDTADTDAARGGVANQTIGQANLPAVSPTFTGTPTTPTFTGTPTTPTFSGTPAVLNGSFSANASYYGPSGTPALTLGNSGAQSTIFVSTPLTAVSINYTPAGTISAITPAGTISAITPAGTISALGSGTALAIMNPFALGTWYIKL